MTVLERRIEKLEMLVPPEQTLKPCMMFNMNGAIKTNIDGKDYASLTGETEQSFRERVELETGQEFFWIAIVPLRGEG